GELEPEWPLVGEHVAQQHQHADRRHHEREEGIDPLPRVRAEDLIQVGRPLIGSVETDHQPEPHDDDDPEEAEPDAQAAQSFEHEGCYRRVPSPVPLAPAGSWTNGTALPPNVYCGKRPSHFERYCCWMSGWVSEAATPAVEVASASPLMRVASATPLASSRAASPRPLAAAAMISAWRWARTSSSPLSPHFRSS